MEIIKDFIFFFYNSFFDNNPKNDFYIDQLIKNLDYLFLIIMNNLIMVVIFIIIIILLVYLNLKKLTAYYSILFINIFIFYLILLIFPINIPFTDTYNELNLLFSNNINNYLLNVKYSEGFLFFVFRLLHILIYKFFDLNYYIIININFLFFVFSIFLIIKYLEKLNLKNYIIFFILIYFNGKWFIHFYEPVNIVWTFNFFIILLFLSAQQIKNIFLRKISLILLYVFSVLNFKAGIVLFIYSAIYGVICKDKLRNKLFYIISPIILFYLINNFVPVNSIGELKETNSLNIALEKYLFSKNYFTLIFNFFALHALVFTPFIFPLKYLAITSVLVQYIFIIKKIFSKTHKKLDSIRNFLLTNPYIVIGVLGCLLISFSRDDYNQSRYLSFSILFQLGFLIFFIKTNFFNKLKNFIIRKIVISIFIFLYLLNLFIPHQGILFALGKNYIYKTVMECLMQNKNNNICLPEMFYLTFYDVNKEHYVNFEKSIYILKKNNLSIFNKVK